MYIFHLISIGYKKKSNIFIVSNLDKKREKIYRKDMHFKKVIILKQHLHVTSKIKPILGIGGKKLKTKNTIQYWDKHIPFISLSLFLNISFVENK